MLIALDEMLSISSNVLIEHKILTIFDSTCNVVFRSIVHRDLKMGTITDEAAHMRHVKFISLMH